MPEEPIFDASLIKEYMIQCFKNEKLSQFQKPVNVKDAPKIIFLKDSYKEIDIPLTKDFLILWNRRKAAKSKSVGICSLLLYEISFEDQSDQASPGIKVKLIVSINFYSSHCHCHIDLTFCSALNNMNESLFQISFSNSGEKKVIWQQQLRYSFRFLFLKKC